MKESTKVISDDEVVRRLGDGLPRWYLEDGQICRRYETSGWRATMLLANAVAHLSEAAFHHPCLILCYASATVKLTTHSASGITDKDFALAEKIESLIMWQPRWEETALTGAPEEGPHQYIKYR
ncbi:MAG: 4a-hydroxytetrahydrobiopterin dehydratase [Gammaproteobacteria bacterium]|nr:4a-hydroxytetrahydrobiopterin dehydratase [Gammaproteobacteria bacterium]